MGDIADSGKSAEWQLPSRASLLVPNFRDVGKTINVLSGETVHRERVLLRGGEVDFVDDLNLIHAPKTIINLRKGVDPAFDGAVTYHCPAPDSVDVYSVSSGFNRKWIMSVLRILASADVEPPFFVHCAAGKDRTGVIVGAILSVIGINRIHIQEDYELSGGPIYKDLFADSLNGFAAIDYFRKLDVDALKEKLRSA